MCLADPVINDVNPLAVCEAPGLLSKILFSIEDDFVGASVAGKLSFLRSSGSADDAGTDHFRHLHE